MMLFPPQCRPFHPHLALPQLKAWMAALGHECKVADLNVRFYRYALSPEAQELTAANLASVVAIDRRKRLTGGKAVLFARRALALVRAGYVRENTPRAIEIFKSSEFYDLGKHAWACKVIEEALEFFSSAYGHTDFGFSRLRMKYGTASPGDILSAAKDRAENPFAGPLAAWADEEVGAFRPDAVCVTIPLDEQLIPAVTLARHLRRTWNGLLIAGGSMVTRLRRELEREGPLTGLFDHYVPFEGAPALSRLASLVGSPPAPEKVVEALAAVPDFDDLDLDAYFLPERMLPYMISTGCGYGKCAYCGHYRTYSKYSPGNPEGAALQLKTLSEKYRARRFYFVDEALEPAVGDRFASSAAAIGLDVRWMVFGRLHKGWNAGFIERMAKAGCRRLIFGLDGSTPRVQALMNKHTDLELASRILSRCDEHGIAVQVNFIVGFPGEREEEARKSLDYVKNNRQCLSGVGSNAAFTAFDLVKGAAWEKMDITPVVEPSKPFALYYAYHGAGSMGMDKAALAAQECQTEADAMLAASWRSPLLREFAFLYRCRHTSARGAAFTPFHTASAAPLCWFNHNIAELAGAIEKSRKGLKAVPQEYISHWWRIANECSIESVKTDNLYGYRPDPSFFSNVFELPVREVVVWPGVIDSG